MISELPLPKGKAMMLTGYILVVLGVFALFSPVAAGGTVIKIIGVILALAGLAEFVHAFRTITRFDTVMSSMLAVITLGAAMLMLFDTTAASGFLTIILVVFFVFQGLWKMSYAIRLRKVTGWVWLLGSGLLSLLLAWMMWKQWPLSGAWAIGILIGMDFILAGVALIFLATKLRRLARSEPQTVPDPM
jgi:uncharacterized membrane protein HdeD (DUF308 family)